MKLSILATASALLAFALALTPYLARADGNAPVAPPVASPVATPAATPAASSRAAEPPEPGLVNVESTRPGTVVEHRANVVRGWTLTIPPAATVTEQWESVCVAPCAVRLDRNSVYKIDGLGVAPSSEFVLPRGPDPLFLHVDARSKLWHDLGTGTTFLGVSAIIVGGALASTASTRVDAERSALFVAAPGLVLALIGVVLRVVNGSSVETSDGHSL